MTDYPADVDTLARTLYGEARGEGTRGRQAVANVVMNRVQAALDRGMNWWGDDIMSVCKAPWQFSCWNKNDPNLKLIETVDESNDIFAECLELASKAAQHLLDDITNGATSYYSTFMPEPPQWARGLSPCAEINHHLFFKL